VILDFYKNTYRRLFIIEYQEEFLGAMRVLGLLFLIIRFIYWLPSTKTRQHKKLTVNKYVTSIDIFFDI